MTLRKLTILLALLMLSGPANARSQMSGSDSSISPLVIGETLSVYSTALGETRNINIYLPQDYSKGSQRYPVLYVLDGGLDQDFLHVSGTAHLGAIWARSQSVIVVGIETKDRRRELVGPTQNSELLEKYPTAGSSSLFRKFIRSDIMPAIKRRYRTSNESGVIGESLAGLFIVETYLRDPALFTHYAAISPSLWWDDRKLAAEASALMKKNIVNRTGRLYLNMADEGPETQEAMDLLIAALKNKTGWCYKPEAELSHSTIYHTTSPAALQFMFPGPTDPAQPSVFKLNCTRSG